MTTQASEPKIENPPVKPMGIAEMIRHIGDEHIEIQNLANNMTRFDQRKGHAEIAFNTSSANGQQTAKASQGIKTGVIGLVIWFPRNRLPEELQ